MTIDKLQIDTKNRKQALDSTQSFIIEAPAGAGKTELLTQRFLALLAKVNEPEEIVALTFTNKAAAEMRHRIVSSLQMSASGKPPDKEHKHITYELGLEVVKRDKERQWRLLEHAGRLQVTTLDALCGRLVRQMPLMSRFGSQPGIATDAEPYYALASLATFQTMEDSTPEALAIRHVLDYFDNDAGKFQSMVATMLATRDQWLRQSSTNIDLQTAERALTVLIEDELTQVAMHLGHDAQNLLMPIARFAASQALTAQTAGDLPDELVHVTNLTRWGAPLKTSFDELPLWQGVSELLLTKSGSLRSRLPAALGLGSGEGKKLGTNLKDWLEVNKNNVLLEESLQRIQRLPSPFYKTEEEQLIRDLMQVLHVAKGHLWLIFKEARKVDFTEMGQNALAALGSEWSPSDLQLRLDYKISHLLVDEFQDTSPTQVELLKRLTLGWMPNDGRTLFLVGDPMQSIYKFRKADVGLFLKVKTNHLGNLRLTNLNLYRNNRSHQEVVDWVNDVFPRVFADQDNYHRGAVKFTAAQATKGGDPSARIEWHPIIDASAQNEDDDDGSPADQREALEIVRIIRQCQTEDPKRSIAILVRARSHLQSLVDVLKTESPRLSYQAVEIEGLAHRQVIQDLMSLTHALIHKGDRTHWLAILRAPWCGLKLEDLHILAADDHQATVWSLMNDDVRIRKISEDGLSRLMHVRDVLNQGFAHQGRHRLKRWVEGIWQALGGPNCLCNEADLVDAKAYFKVLDELDEQGHPDLGKLLVEVDKLYAAPDPTASSRLQIMTIHKSKGLEFDTVILPGLHKKSPPVDKKLLLWDEVIGPEGGEHLIVAPIHMNHKAESNAASKFEFLNKFEGERNRNETQRLLYVAVTRAKRQLHLVGCAKINTQSSLTYPSKDSFLNLLWHEAQSRFDSALVNYKDKAQAAPEADEPKIDKATFIHKLVRLKHPVRPEVLCIRANSPIDCKSEDHSQVEVDSTVVTYGTVAEDVGTLVHRYLEIIANSGLSSWTSTRVEGLSFHMQRWFCQRGHPVNVAMSAAREVISNLVTTLESKDGRWILGAHVDSGCEVPFGTVNNGVMETLRIDRAFVDDGVRWIIDYKTTRKTIQTDEEWAPYQQQLERYRGMYGPDELVKCGLFFTRTGELFEMPGD